MSLPGTSRRRRALRGLLAVPLLALLLLPAGVRGAGGDTADEIHYTFTGATSVAFDWRGTPTDIQYGLTSAYGQTATAQDPTPEPFSSSGPFREVELTGLQAGTTYHYSIGGGADATFETAPTGNFRFDVEADVGSSLDYSTVAPTQSQIADDKPDLVLVPGDLSYGSPFGQPSVDQFFNDVMPWSQKAAFMPAWGNHEWESPAADDLRNYKGRFMLPNPGTMPSAPAPGCCGEDWSWFDAGGVRFISYPEPYASVTWSRWQTAVDPVFADAQNDPSIHFIVTFGHRPAYSTGFHSGSSDLATVLNALGDKYSKYQLNINGHSHDYERFQPIHGVTHVTAGGGGAALEPPWAGTDPRTIFRAMHLEHLRVDVTSDGMRVQSICGPPTTQDDITCVPGSVIDSFTLGTNPPPPPPPPSTLYVDNTNSSCTDKGAGTQAQPFCTINAAASIATAGQTVQVGNGTYAQEVHPKSSGTSSKPINYIAAPGAKPTVVGGSGATSGGFYLLGVSWITIQGFTVAHTNGDGIAVKNSTNITLRGNNVSFAGQPVQGAIAKGVRIDGSTDCVVANNKLHHNTSFGVYLLNGSTRNTIIGNDIHDNAAQYERVTAGIRIYQSSANTITANTTYDNEDSGIEFFNTATNNLVTNNISYDNGDHGIDNNNSSGQTIVSNTVYDNVTAGINAEGTSTGTTIRNNVSVDNGVNSPRTRSNIRVDATSQSGSTLDDDLVNLSAPGSMIVWGSTSYSSLTAFTAAVGQETHGIQANPRWTDPADGDFTLQDGSPAIDSADSGASGQPSQDAHGNGRLDDPAVPNTGAGPRRYDDRGALEHQLDEVVDLPPNVVLNVNPSGGTVPLAVTADASATTDTDATPIDTYDFDFGDGTDPGPQQGATATHTYRTPGLYTVKVTVTDRAGLSSTATTQVRATAQADAPPSSVLSVSPASGNAPLQVTADGSGSSDTDSTPIDTYRFDFGDGSSPGPQNGATAAHTYDTPGTYTVSMTVTDTGGLSSTATTQVTVTAPPDAPPAADLSVAPSAGLAPLDVVADASTSTDTDANPIASYSFDFGDGTVTGPQADPTAAHTYLFEGTYTVTVTVTDTAGLSSTASRQVGVTPDTPPTAALSVTPSSGTAPLDVSVDAAASTDPDNAISSYAFDFGDGSGVVTQDGPTAAHTYSAPGTFTVTVTVTDSSGNTSAASKQVTVTQPDAPPNAVVAANPSTGPAPLDVTADASGSTDTDANPIATYRFTFGDNSGAVGPQAGATATHTYTAAGTYTVTVTVTDTAGMSTTATTQVTVTNRDFPPTAALTVTPGAGVTPLAVTADASGSTDGDTTSPIATYAFDFGDNSPVVGPQGGSSATHTYAAPGTYTVKMTVTDTAGLASTATVKVSAYANFVGNSGFESDLSGWNTSGGGTGISLTRVSGGHTGSWAAKLTNTTGAASTELLNDSPDWARPTTAGTYTGSLWVRADTPGAKLNLRFREYSGTTLVGTDTTTVTLSTTWQMVTVTHRTVSPGSTLDLNAYVPTAAAGSSWYADDAAVYLTG